MNILLLPLSYFLSGFLMKLSDDEYDEKNNIKFAIIYGVICGIFTAIASIISGDATCIFVGILIGTLLALKIDGLHHIVTLLTFFILLAVFGFPSFNAFLLIFIIIGALVDEWGNDNPKFYTGGFLQYFFDYRFTLKIVILLLAIFGYFQWYTFICFILFDLGYESARILFNKYFLLK